MGTDRPSANPHFHQGDSRNADQNWSQDSTDQPDNNNPEYQDREQFAQHNQSEGNFQGHYNSTGNRESNSNEGCPPAQQVHQNRLVSNIQQTGPNEQSAPPQPERSEEQVIKHTMAVFLGYMKEMDLRMSQMQNQYQNILQQVHSRPNPQLYPHQPQLVPVNQQSFTLA